MDIDLDDLAPRLERAAARVGPVLYRKTKHQATLLRVKIQKHASGRPGPNVITDDYRGSWTVDPQHIPHGGSMTIGTDRPQGRRLEFGFYDRTDSLGRHFFQPPFPHVGPAVEEISPRLLGAFQRAAAEILQ